MLSENANPIRLHAIKFNLYNILEMKMNRLDESKWYFQSNFDESWMPHLEACFKFSKLPYRIEDEAYDIHGNLLPGQKACYIPKEYEESKEPHLFWEYFKQLCEQYRKYLQMPRL